MAHTTLGKCDLCVYRRVPTRPLAFSGMGPQVADMFTLTIYDANRRTIDDGEQSDANVKVVALLFGPVDHAKQKHGNGNLSPVG